MRKSATKGTTERTKTTCERVGLHASRVVPLSDGAQQRDGFRGGPTSRRPRLVREGNYDDDGEDRVECGPHIGVGAGARVDERLVSSELLPVEPDHNHCLVCAGAEGLAEAVEGGRCQYHAEAELAERVEEEGYHVQDEAEQQFIFLAKVIGDHSGRHFEDVRKGVAHRHQNTNLKHIVAPFEQDDDQVRLKELEVLYRSVKTEAPHQAVALDEPLDLLIRALSDRDRVNRVDRVACDADRFVQAPFVLSPRRGLHAGSLLLAHVPPVDHTAQGSAQDLGFRSAWGDFLILDG